MIFIISKGTKVTKGKRRYRLALLVNCKSIQ